MSEKYKLVPMEPTERLLPCPFCGSYDIGNRYVETYSCDSSYDIFGCEDCGANFNNDDQAGPALWNQRVATPAVHGEPVAYLRKDQLRQVQRMGTMLGEIADSPRVDRVPVYATPQPAEQQPDATQLVEALVMARGTIAAALRANALDWFGTDEDIARHLSIKQIDAALAAHRKQGGES